MFQTVTANPLLITQGSHLCVSQEYVNEKTKTVQRRYVIIDSETLEATPYTEKSQFEQAISDLIEAYQRPKKKSNPLDSLAVAEPEKPAVQDVAAEEDSDGLQS